MGVWFMYVKKQDELRKTEQGINTRGKRIDSLVVSKRNTTQGMRHCSYTGPKLYNEILSAIRETYSNSSFKIELPKSLSNLHTSK